MTPRKTQSRPGTARASSPGPAADVLPPDAAATLAGEALPPSVTPASPPSSPSSRAPEGSARGGGAEDSGEGAGSGTPPFPGNQPRTWVLEMPAGMTLLSLNDRRHWSVKGRITRDLRHAAWALARQAQIPPLGRAKVTVEYQPPLVTRRRDHDNVAPASGKPAIDGALTDAKVLVDDSPEYLTEVTYRIGKPYPEGRLVLTITEVIPP